jgi:glycosyltransferase involved in cell wall biosynthesis
MAACDAVVQEVEWLRSHVSGVVHHLYPSRKPGTRWPRRWWGLTQLLVLRRLERDIDLHHIFNPDPYPFALLRWLRRPVVYTVVTGTQGAKKAMPQQLARLVRQIVVPADSDLKQMQAWQVSNTMVIQPGIDVARFSYTSPADGTPFTLLLGSAPWTLDQFRSKGVDVMLQLAQQHTALRLVFLWRGILFDEMRWRVRALGLENRVEILNELVDVNAVLARVHAAAVLAEDEVVIKAYPHSLLEALAAGKPVIVSRLIPLSQEVERSGTGVVVDRLSLECVSEAVDHLVQNYASFQQATYRDCVPSHKDAVTAYLDLYERVLAVPERRP